MSSRREEFGDEVGGRGVDSLQALALAMTFTRKRLEDFLAKGGRILHVDGTEYPPDAVKPSENVLDIRLRDPTFRLPMSQAPKESR